LAVSRSVPSTPITKEEEEEEILLTSAQQGLILTATSEGKIIHRPVFDYSGKPLILPAWSP
jgi:hypothetical protein